MSQEEIIQRLNIQYDELEGEDEDEESEEEEDNKIKTRLDSIIEEEDEEATEYQRSWSWGNSWNSSVKEIPTWGSVAKKLYAPS